VGVFSVPIEIGDPDGTRFEHVDALVGAGATFTMVPASVLRNLGLEPEERGAFELADGSLQEFGLAETRLRIDGQETSTVVVFGSEDMTPLLGAYTLERVRLAVGPAGKRLIRVPWRMM
jgi:predicted aspartyl protease